MADLINQLGWIDLGTLVVLLVFFVMGLFRGLVWQLSRLLTLVVGFVVAGIWAKDLEALLVRTWPSFEPFAIFLAYFAIFFAVFVLLSVAAWLLSGLLRKLKLTAYDRLGGGVLGLATGAAVVVLLLTILFSIPMDQGVIQAAERSRTKPAAVKALRFLEGQFHFAFLEPVLRSLDPQQAPAPTPKQEPEQKK